MFYRESLKLREEEKNKDFDEMCVYPRMYYKFYGTFSHNAAVFVLLKWNHRVSVSLSSESLFLSSMWT